MQLVLAILAVTGHVVRAASRSQERRPFNEVYSLVEKHTPWIPWNRLLECSPQDYVGYPQFQTLSEDNAAISVAINKLGFKCDNTDTRTTNLTVPLTYTGECDRYKRRCEKDTFGSDPIVKCTEDYDGCTITNTNYISNLNATGVAPEVIAECIPAIGALRDGCNVTMGNCTTEFKYQGNNNLLECKINCVELNIMCQNYTRNCSKEFIEVVNVGGEQTVSIILDDLQTDCEYTTNERHVTQEARWNGTKFIDDLKVEHPGKTYLKQVTTQIVWEKEDSWESCVENTQVFYKPVCNYFIANIMDPLQDVVFEPNAHNITEGIKMFLSQWDEGWHELCNEHCFLHLVKFSRGCWPTIPLQRFMPNADYQTVERFLRNVSRIACYNIGPPSVKYSSDLEFLDSRNSCLAFFDKDHNLTRVFYQNITQYCDEDDANMCDNKNCISALDGISERFGCCLGSIMYSYREYADWLALFNFNNHPILRRMEQCKTKTTVKLEECENQFVTSIVVTIVRNFIYIMGGIMGFVIVIMSISFYWQLEHEPIKKAFYHF